MEGPVTITIKDLATGPTAPRANTVWPNVLHTRVDEVVRQMGPPPRSRCRRRGITMPRASSVGTRTTARANGAHKDRTGEIMPRLTPITSKDQIDPKHHAVVDSIVASRGGIQGPFTAFLHSPEIAGR